MSHMAVKGAGSSLPSSHQTPPSTWKRLFSQFRVSVIEMSGWPPGGSGPGPPCGDLRPPRGFGEGTDHPGSLQRQLWASTDRPIVTSTSDWWIRSAETALGASARCVRTVPPTGAASPERNTSRHRWTASGMTLATVGSTTEVRRRLAPIMGGWTRGLWSRWLEDSPPLCGRTGTEDPNPCCLWSLLRNQSGPPAEAGQRPPTASGASTLKRSSRLAWRRLGRTSRASPRIKAASRKDPNPLKTRKCPDRIASGTVQRAGWIRKRWRAILAWRHTTWAGWAPVWEVSEVPRDHQVNKETGCTGVALEVSLLVEKPLGRFVIKSNAKNPRRYLQSQLGIHCFGRLQKGAA